MGARRQSKQQLRFPRVVRREGRPGAAGRHQGASLVCLAELHGPRQSGLGSVLVEDSRRPRSSTGRATRASAATHRLPPEAAVACRCDCHASRRKDRRVGVGTSSRAASATVAGKKRGFDTGPEPSGFSPSHLIDHPPLPKGVSLGILCSSPSREPTGRHHE
jgi:hypothetical protein